MHKCIEKRNELCSIKNGTSKSQWTIKEEVRAAQGADKCIHLQKLENKQGQIEYRFAYYALDRNQEWKFVLRPLMVPTEQLRDLIKQAKDRKWEGFLAIAGG